MRNIYSSENGEGYKKKQKPKQKPKQAKQKTKKNQPCTSIQI